MRSLPYQKSEFNVALLCFQSRAIYAVDMEFCHPTRNFEFAVTWRDKKILFCGDRHIQILTAQIEELKHLDKASLWLHKNNSSERALPLFDRPDEQESAGAGRPNYRLARKYVWR